MDAGPDGGGGQGAIFYFVENAFGFLGILAREQQNVIQLNPGFARV